MSSLLHRTLTRITRLPPLPPPHAITHHIRHANTKASEIRVNNLIDDTGKLLQVKAVTKREMGRGHTTYSVEVIERLFGANTGVGKKSYVKYNASDEVNVVTLSAKPLQYLYKDDLILYFMNNDTYEQVEIDSGILDTTMHVYLIDGTTYSVQYYNDAVIGIDIPEKVNMTVISTMSSTSGDSQMLKEAEVQNGLKVNVPVFIGEGEEIVIKSSTGAYLQRAKDT